MSISELLARRDHPLFSFELYPPRNADEERRAWFTVRRLEQLQPDFVSVTYGASGSTCDRTIKITEQIASTTTLRTMAHLTAASQSRAELRKVIWPTRKELVTYAVVVIIFVAVILAIVGLLDLGFSKAALWVFGGGKNNQ